MEIRSNLRLRYASYVDAKAHSKHYKEHPVCGLSELVSKDILDIISRGNSQLRCSKHPHILSNSYCCDCNVIFCNSKCIVEHQKCEISVNCDQILFEKKEEIKFLMQKAEKAGDQYRETIKQFGKQKRDAENALRIVKSTVEKEFNSLIKSIEERKQEILAKSDAIYNPTIEAYIEESTNIYRKMKSLTDATQFCDLVLKSDHKSSLPEVVDNYKKLFASSDISKSTYLPEYRFSIDRSIKHSITSLGKLTVVRENSSINSIFNKLQLPCINDINTIPIAIAIDKQQRMYILDDITFKIRIFNISLEIEHEFDIYEDVGQMSMKVSDEYIFLCFHEQNFIRVFTKFGKQLKDLEGGKSGSQDLFVFGDSFTGIDCSGGGNLVVADSGKNRVHIYNPDLSFSHFIGELFEAGALRRPVSVAINTSDHVAVLQWANPCINLYTIKGILLCQFGSLLGSLELVLPVKLVYLPTDKLLVLDYKSSNVSVYNAAKNMLTRYEGLLQFPYKEDDKWSVNVTCNSEGDLYVCDAYSKEIWMHKNFT